MLALYITLDLVVGLAFVKMITKLDEEFLGTAFFPGFILWPLFLLVFLGKVVNDSLQEWCE